MIGSAEATRRLPPLRAKSLDGEVVVIPDELDGDVRILIVAFQRRQQELVDGWLAGITAAAPVTPRLAVYEVPTIHRRFVPARALIDGGMARAVSDRFVRRRTLTLYSNVDAVRDALGISSTRTVAVLVIDEHGVVRWSTQGPFRAAAAETLVQVVRELLDSDE